MFAQGILEVRQKKLYRLEYNTFEEFCQTELGITQQYATQTLRSAEVVKNLESETIVSLLPQTESQARPLTKLEPEIQRQTWRDVTEKYKPEEITAKKVEQEAKEWEEANSFVKEEKAKAQKPADVFAPESNAPLTDDEILERAKELRRQKNEAKKEKRRDDIQKQAEQIEQGELPQLEGKFHVVSVDPPWPYGREYDPDSSRVANPYPEMGIEQIKGIDLPVADNSVLFLWTTHAFLKDSFSIAEQWGFTHKATIVWDKEKIGMGAWLRMQCEFCLVCIKGKPFWDNTKYRDIIRSPRREHSRKPDEFYDLVASSCEGRKLEYFSREAREGWEIFGNEIDKF